MYKGVEARDQKPKFFLQKVNHLRKHTQRWTYSTLRYLFLHNIEHMQWTKPHIGAILLHKIDFFVALIKYWRMKKTVSTWRNEFSNIWKILHKYKTRLKGLSQACCLSCQLSPFRPDIWWNLITGFSDVGLLDST